MTSKNIDIDNVRLAAELSHIYNRLLQTIVKLDEPYTPENVQAELTEIADGIRESLGELNLYRFETRGDMNYETKHIECSSDENGSSKDRNPR